MLPYRQGRQLIPVRRIQMTIATDTVTIYPHSAWFGTLHHQKQFLTPETLRDIYFTGINHFTTIRIETC